MNGLDSQLTASQILLIFSRSELHLFLGAAFITVGFVSAAFSLLRRRMDALLLWLALFAVLYGGRLCLQTDFLSLMLPHTKIFRELRVGINYLIPIPAVFFFDAVGFLGRWGKAAGYTLTVVFLSLIAGTFVLGPLNAFQQINDVVIVIVLLALVALSLRRRSASRDFVVIRIGLLCFVVLALYDNVADTLGFYPNVEAYGFAAFLACLGYVAALQTLRRDAQLGEIQKELEVARRIQLSILPTAFPPSTSFRVAARYLPMTSVAGDFYDFLVGDDRQAGLLIADVSGHGVPAALIASMVKLAAVSQRDRVADPAAVLTAMNAALCGNAQQQFVTAAFVHLDVAAGEIRYSAAGHPPMLLLRDGEVTAIEENGLLLAAFSFATYSNTVRALQPGDRLVLYTDGILEAADAKSEEFGQARLQALLRTSAGLPHTQTADLIVSAVQKWAVCQEDDLTVLVCDYAATA